MFTSDETGRVDVRMLAEIALDDDRDEQDREQDVLLDVRSATATKGLSLPVAAAA